MAYLDRIGTYRGPIVEHGVAFSKSKKPQFAVCLKAAEKWVDSPEELKHFDLKEPGWVDWSSFDETIRGYLLLFNDPDTYSVSGPNATAMFHYENLCHALGWSGTSFDDLGNDSYVGKEVLFRVEEHTYNDKTSLQVQTVEAYDAPPTRGIRKLDSSALSDLNARLSGIRRDKPAPAKPAPAPASAPAPAEVEGGEGAEGVSLAEAWEAVQAGKGDHTDIEVQNAWVAEANKVAGDRDEADLTEQDWAKVRDLVLAVLSH